MRNNKVFHNKYYFKQGFTLIELIVSTGIITFLLGAIFSVLMSSNSSWRIGRDSLIEQRSARRVVSEIQRLLRSSNPNWVDDDGTSYPVTISESGARIDFYVPTFNTTGQIDSFKKVTFKLNPDTENLRQLLKKEGIANAVVVADDVDSINFGGGCAGCSAFNCATVADDCPRVLMQVTTKRDPGGDQEYELNSQVTFRNLSVIIPNDIEVEEPGEGEF